MPIYEYECKKCAQITEVIQGFSESPLTKCPECGGKTKKLMSMNTFHLKGSGWYVTDYANKSNQNSMSDNTESGPETPKKDKKKQDGSKKKTTKKKKSSTPANTD